MAWLVLLALLAACGAPPAGPDAGRPRVLDSGPPPPPAVVCEGSPAACSEHTVTVCDTVPGCQLSEECEGFAHCGQPDRASCERVRGCRWEMDLYCGGTAASCTTYPYALECEAVGCEWVRRNECAGTPRACASLNASECLRAPGCRPVGADAGADGGAIDGGAIDGDAGASDGGALPTITALFGKGNHTCVLLDDGRLVCWGANQSGQLGTGTPSDFETATVIEALATYDDVAVGGAHSCARSGPDVWCWGSSSQAQLGNGIVGGEEPDPVRVDGVTATGVHAGYATTCIMEGSVARCVGSEHGLTGRLTGEVIWSPTAWADRDDVAVMILGGGDACARTTSGRVHCTIVGSERTYPYLVPEWEGAEQVVVGYEFACARDEGRVSCYGDNGAGQLGDGTTTDRYYVAPVEVAIPGTVVDLSAGFAFACAATSAGEVYCWGENRETQLSYPDFVNRPTPTLVSELSGVREVECGYDHCCAWIGGLDVRCWGRNELAQTGIPPAPAERRRATPQPVPFDLRGP